MLPKEKGRTKSRGNAEIKLIGHSKQLPGAGWYKKKAEIILRFSPGHEERDSQVEGN